MYSEWQDTHDSSGSDKISRRLETGIGNNGFGLVPSAGPFTQFPSLPAKSGLNAEVAAQFSSQPLHRREVTPQPGKGGASSHETTGLDSDSRL